MTDNLIFNDNGILFKPGNFYIDPKKPVMHAVTTHAHADHIVKANQHVYTHYATADLFLHRYKKNNGTQFHCYPYNQPFTLNGIAIEFLPAGHMLGSAQILITYNNTRYLFTGDFKLQTDSSCTPYQFCKADVLITESTFANPQIKHPTVDSQLNQFNQHLNNRILLGCYSLGKAQRLTALLTQQQNRPVLIHHQIAGFHKVYKKHNIQLGNWLPYHKKFFKSNSNAVYVVPPVTYKYYYNTIGAIKAFASGWKQLQHGADMELYLSDHADWYDILNVISQTQPRYIITHHGDGSHLQSHFKNKIEVLVY
ncbi:MAG: exonuclease [Bacteroidia bacterium]|nr:exonuclease [Bacteroidia bacterium]